MENILFKKSYLHKSFKRTYFDDLWNKKGVFTTIRVIGNPRRFLFMKEHLINLNKSLKKLSIDIQVDQFFLNNIVYTLFKKRRRWGTHGQHICVFPTKVKLDGLAPRRERCDRHEPLCLCTTLGGRRE